MSIDLSTFQQVVAVFGPLLVALITGLNTPSKVKAALAIALVAVMALIQGYIEGFSGDLVADTMAVVVIWQSLYALLWRGTGVAAWLQENVPVKLFESAE